MSHKFIPGGYYIKSRKIHDSDVAYAPPHVREIWDWLIAQANHKDSGRIKRGQTMRNISDIIDGLKWYVGFKKMAYSYSQCENAVKWLRKKGMITTQKTTRGSIITIVNYDFYQTAANYESQKPAETHDEHMPDTCRTINKNVKNGRRKNDKNINDDVSNNIYNINLFRKENNAEHNETTEHNEAAKHKETAEHHETAESVTQSGYSFSLFWELYDKKRGNKALLERKWNSLAAEEKQKAVEYIPLYKAAQPNKQYRKDPLTFITNKAWNDEIISSVNVKPFKINSYAGRAGNQAAVQHRKPGGADTGNTQQDKQYKTAKL
jgi:hypothetical protein